MFSMLHHSVVVPMHMKMWLLMLGAFVRIGGGGRRCVWDVGSHCSCCMVSDLTYIPSARICMLGSLSIVEDLQCCSLGFIVRVGGRHRVVLWGGKCPGSLGVAVYVGQWRLG